MSPSVPAVAALSFALASVGSSCLLDANVAGNAEVLRLCDVSALLVAGEFKSACVGRCCFASQYILNMCMNCCSNSNFGTGSTANRANSTCSVVRNGDATVLEMRTFTVIAAVVIISATLSCGFGLN